jgi:hypothetical protein
VPASTPSLNRNPSESPDGARERNGERAKETFASVFLARARRGWPFRRGAVAVTVGPSGGDGRNRADISGSPSEIQRPAIVGSPRQTSHRALFSVWVILLCCPASWLRVLHLYTSVDRAHDSRLIKIKKLV